MWSVILRLLSDLVLLDLILFDLCSHPVHLFLHLLYPLLIYSLDPLIFLFERLVLSLQQCQPVLLVEAENASFL